MVGIYSFSIEPVKNYKKPYYFAPPEVIKHFSFGYNDVYADLLWIRYIQDADFCNSEQGTPVYDGNKKYKCDKGWGFYMANAITALAPKFRKPYLFAGSILGILSGDKEGARIIFDKAIQQFPNDWEVLFSAAHHYLFELDNKATAASLLIRSVENGGPMWLYTLAAKLYTESGKKEVAEQLLQKLIKDDPNSPYVEGFKNKLKEIKNSN